MIEKLDEINDVIKKQIDVYKNIKDLYNDKRNILIAGDLTLLEKMDNEIIIKANEVNKYELRRQILCKELGISQNGGNLSEIINYAEINSYDAQNFINMKKIINNLVDEIKELDKVNRALLAKTSEIIDSTIKIITNNVFINTCEYNNTGKKLENKGLELSSIIEEG